MKSGATISTESTALHAPDMHYYDDWGTRAVGSEHFVDMDFNPWDVAVKCYHSNLKSSCALFRDIGK